ncbi:MAG: tRNA epoxyqueuosine(34) reductase QueG [Caldiserica bacterium]|nr:tRNA epoxyqueuosine(34) reductase QueG [Caldisericota bacterium]MDH7562286.1 tRNA epoxyqueuosine(34) reductase QueG [Caldisericota bacterium]
MPEIRSIIQKVKDLSGKLGLFLEVAPIKKLEPRTPLKEALAKRGIPPSLGWTEKDLPGLLDPREIYPWARGILCFAQPYSREEESKGDEPCGEIADFCSRDWYGLLKEKLRMIKAEIISSFPNLKAKVFVEGKILEKTWGEVAGIGWRGKNSLLLRKGTGSRILLGEILISEEVEETGRPMESKCGECTLCLEACPTGAIIKPFQVLPNLCLDYFTLHYDGILPQKIREKMGNRLFGCSACQEICPYNRDNPETFGPRPSGPGFSFPLEKALKMDEEEFQRIFTGHTFKGKSLSLLKRNALVVAGNSREKSLFELVEPFAFDSFSLLRVHALWSLWRIDSERASKVFRRIRHIETNPRILKEIETLEEEGIQKQNEIKGGF